MRGPHIGCLSGRHSLERTCFNGGFFAEFAKRRNNTVSRNTYPNDESWDDDCGIIFLGDPDHSTNRR